VDTPGIFAPKRRLDRAMVQSAWQGAEEADVIVLLIDARKGITEEDEAILDRLPDIPQPKFLVLNKVDLVERPVLLKLAERANAATRFTDTFMISALSGEGVDDLKTAISNAVPAGVWHYPEDHLSDLPLRMLAAEITREKLFLRVHDELPYSLTVETEAWENRRDGSVKINQVIYVAREAHRRIILGHRGEAIKGVSMEARKEMAELLGHPVHLFLFVKVRKNWVDDPDRYRELGLEFPG
ncbi:MAG: GTPase Era, partial [Rhodobiaceae bacterium]|nr:GTPase Era [Rhodobiaceae bacterium]